MRGLLKILLGGSVAFMALAIAQEWEFFAGAWFGSASTDPVVSEPVRREAADAVRELLTLMGHFYATGGDPRFAERLPASEPLVAEMREDVAFLAHRHRVQEPALRRLEVEAVEGLGEGRVEVRTREFWTVRQRWARGGAVAEPPRAYVTRVRYFVRASGEGWRVEGWELGGPD